jgi:hypothetical protein
VTEGHRRGHAALRLRADEQGQPDARDAQNLVIKTRKNAGQHPSVASLYRALAEIETV